MQRNLCPLSFVDVAQQTYISAMLGVYELNRVELLRSQVVAQVVRSKLTKVQAVELVQRTARAQTPGQDNARFVEVTENQLLSLHEGNIARYRLRPSEFHAWRKNWLL